VRRRGSCTTTAATLLLKVACLLSWAAVLLACLSLRLCLLFRVPPAGIQEAASKLRLLLPAVPSHTLPLTFLYLPAPFSWNFSAAAYWGGSFTVWKMRWKSATYHAGRWAVQAVPLGRGVTPLCALSAESCSAWRLLHLYSVTRWDGWVYAGENCLARASLLPGTSALLHAMHHPRLATCAKTAPVIPVRLASCVWLLQPSAACLGGARRASATDQSGD